MIPALMGAVSVGGFTPVSIVDVTSTAGVTVPWPAGALYADIIAIGGGEAGTSTGSGGNGGYCAWVINLPKGAIATLLVSIGAGGNPPSGEGNETQVYDYTTESTLVTAPGGGGSEGLLRGTAYNSGGRALSGGGGGGAGNSNSPGADSVGNVGGAAGSGELPAGDGGNAGSQGGAYGGGGGRAGGGRNGRARIIFKASNVNTDSGWSGTAVPPS